MTENNQSTYIKRIGKFLPYAIAAFIIVVSNLLWYNFNLPPITGNSGFDVFPVRSLKISLLPFNPYSWPVSYLPPILGMPSNLLYTLFYVLSGNSYAVAIFISNLFWEVLGGFSLLYLSRVFLKHIQIDPRLAYVSVVYIAFNEGIIQGAQFDMSASLLAIAIVLLFLSLYRSRYYALLLGVYSFFLLSSFPAGSLSYAIELLAIYACLGIVYFSSKDHRSVPYLKRYFIVVVFSFIAILAANSYLLYPFLSVKSLYISALTTANPSYAFSFSFDRIEVLQNAVRLINNWADYSSYAAPWMGPYLGNFYVSILLYLAPVLAFSSVFLVRKKIVLLIFIFTIVLVFLSKANNPPLGIVFQWLILHISVLRAFYNGASFSGFLIIAYAILITVSLSNIYVRIRTFLHGSGKIAVRRARNILPALIVVLAVSLMVASVYPSLSGQFEEGNPSTPLGSALPIYYYNASTYLSDHGGSPAIVFPEVNTFNANTVNNTTWYNGVDTYPGIIYSPTVSNSFAANFVGGKGSVYSILSNLYNPNSFNSLLKINRTINFSGYNDINGASVSYSAYLSGSPFNDSVDYLKISSSANFSGYNDINGASVSYSAYLSFAPYNDSIKNISNGIAYSVNKSQYHSGGQWLLGSLDHVVNLSSFTYLTLNYSISNVSESSIQLGLFNPNGAGNWYNFNSYPIIRNGTNSYVVVNLKQSSAEGGGSLNNVSGIVINYDPGSSSAGRGNINIQGYSLTDQSPTIDSKSLTYSVNKSQYHSGGQWLLGSLDHVVNLSSFTYLTLNYSIPNVSASSIELGLFDSNGAGNWYNFNSYPIIRNGTNSYVVVNLKQPSADGGGSLKNVSGIVINYDPGSSSAGNGSIRLLGFHLSTLQPYSDRGVSYAISQDMSILGIKYAYVDTSIDSGNGTYYRDLFKSNPATFSPVFHEGSVYIYRNNAYSGLFSTINGVKAFSNESALLNGLYDNISSDALWVNQSASAQLSGGTYSNTNLTWLSNGYADYTVNMSKIDHKTLLLFRTDFNARWNAYLPNGKMLPHFEVDGYANGYIIPANTSVVLIKYSGLNEYRLIEMLSLSLPLLEFGIFAYALWRRRV